MDTGDRHLHLLHLRKTFSSHLKETNGSDTASFDRLLPLFNKVMHMYTPDEVAAQFKEMPTFCAQMCEILVQEIRKRATKVNTTEAAESIYEFLRASPPDARGWTMVKSIAFMVNCDLPRVVEPICKHALPSTFAKVFYLFFDLPAPTDTQESDIRHRLYDTMVMLMVSLSSSELAAEELIQTDCLVLLFIGASSTCVKERSCWREASFTFLCTIASKALSPSVVKYIHSKGCVGHYVKNLRTLEDATEKAQLLSNLLELLTSSAGSTRCLIDDFSRADGFALVVEVVSRSSLKDAQLIFSSLTGLISGGNETISLHNPTTPLSFFPFQLRQTCARSTATVRVPEAFMVLERCFYDGNDELCSTILEHVLSVYKSEPMNYFILERHYPLYLFVERMTTKNDDVQREALTLVEFVLSELNFIPCKELTAVNTHLKQSVESQNYDMAKFYLDFLLRAVAANAHVRDAYRELLHLETFLNIIQGAFTGVYECDGTAKPMLKVAMEVLLSTTKSHPTNAQFIIENLEAKHLKAIISAIESDLKTSALLLVKNLLMVAKNDQLFGSFLQILFSDPCNISACSVLLRLFATAMLESHKVRTSFRKSGGYICLMTLLIHLENSLPTASASKGDAADLKDKYHILRHISLIFRVITMSMRYEPANANYFLHEVKPDIIVSILRTTGCFTHCSMVDAESSVWNDLTYETSASMLASCHNIFRSGEKILDSELASSEAMPTPLFCAMFLLRLLFDLAMDNCERHFGQNSDIRWAGEDWLRNAENLDSVPVVAWARSFVVHPTAVICILRLLPSIGVTTATKDASKTGMNNWSAAAQYYVALVLKALLRTERNQQIMCLYDMPRAVLEVSEDLLKLEKSPLLSPFHYLFERLACQHMHSRELRHFLRLDKPLCCLNLDDDDNSTAAANDDNSGGPMPIHRVKALVSMLTPRNHSLVHPPAFVEFDMAVEGFASLFIPTLAETTASSGGLSSNERLFPPLNGFTFLTWFFVDEHSNDPIEQQIRLITVLRSSDNIESEKTALLAESNTIERYLTCFTVQLSMTERCLLVSTAEHSVLDEVRRDFVRPPDSFIRVPLSEQFFQTKQWTHLAVVMTRSLLKQSQVDLYLNGRCLASQKLNYVSPNVGGGQTHLAETQTVHALVGTPPFLRRPTLLRWKMSSLHLVDEPLSIDDVRYIFALQPHYTVLNGVALAPEASISLNLNAVSVVHMTLQSLRSMCRKADCEVVASLTGVSPHDNTTPLRLIWNCAAHMPGPPRPLGSVVIGYLGIRTFGPCPVSALLDSIGGIAPLLGLIAMCTDSQGLYASLKVLVSAVETNTAIRSSIIENRSYQTLAILLEEKASSINSHILQLILCLTGTVDVSKEATIIPNLQTFEDLLCDFDVWENASEDVKKLLFEHFYELVIDNQSENLSKIRSSSLLSRLLMLVFETPSMFPVRNDIIFRLVGAIIQPPCDPQSLLRFGQTISATLPTQPDQQENQYPFHIAELEKLLLSTAPSGDVDAQLYAVYVRNRLLNILMTLLSHSSGQVNAQLSETIVETLGFGWILAFCAKGVHTGTLFLAMRILVNVTKYPPLMAKFKDGSSTGGWLTDADSVIRNRAAVLLGFSVSAHPGAVGSHVDINPELSKCSGFYALEQLLCAHSDEPFVYVAVLALLFGQHQANIQRLEEFNIDVIWSNVFGLNSTSSVSDTINKVHFCAEALIPLFAMVRSCLHGRSQNKPAEEADNFKYPIMVMQLINFLYQNSEKFFAICHTEIFVITLFTTLIPPRSNEQSSVDSGSDNSPNGLGSGRCAKTILDLLTNILLNDLCLPADCRTEFLFDALVEYLENGGAMHSGQSGLFSELVNACLEHFMASDMFFANSALMIPKSAEGLLSHSSEATAANVLRFLSKVIDSVWNCIYRGNPVRILKTFLKLLAETHASNKAVAQLACTDAHLNALFRIVLYLLSRPIDNVDTQMSVLDTLAEIVRNQQILLSKSSNNPLFYGALVHLVFMLSERPDIHLHNDKDQHLERGSAQVAMCAQTVWGMLWQQKKPLLDELFKRDVDLDLYSARITCGEIANGYWLQFVDAQTDGGSAANTSSTSTVRNVGQLQQQIQSRISRVAKSGLQRLTSRKSVLLSSISSNNNLAHVQFNFERPRIEPETFHMWIRVHISLMKELLRNQCQRYHEWHMHVRKWCLQEWHNTEAELTRERGLWGPEKRSSLDKFQLDTTEGPCRIRKKLVPNPMFYFSYPYRPHLDAPEAKALRAKVAISKDSQPYYERMRRRRFKTMDERIVDTTTIVARDDAQQALVFDASTELNLSMIKRMVKKNVEPKQALAEDQKSTENEEADSEEMLGSVENGVESEDRRDSPEEKSESSPQPKSPGASDSGDQPNVPRALELKKTAGPDNQTLLRLLEQGEQLHSMFRCARIQGLDTIEGLLLFGREHYYVVDGFTLLKTREIRDLDFLPEQYHDPIVPYVAMGSANRPNTRNSRQCSKFGYDDIKEVHKRRYLLQPIALEVLTADGRNYLLAFPRRVRDRVHQKLVAMAKNASSDIAKSMAEQRKLRPAEVSAPGSALISSLIGQQSITQRWQRGEISNFSYLMYLNTLAGRSYNDLSQYPVFPWIVKDYESEILDLSDPNSFRDLSRPMGAQSPERLAQFLKRYREWDDPTGDTPPYMYGTHYNSAMIVLSYLVRLEPFTQQFLNLQGGHFDLADRMFHSVRDAWMSASRNNMADVKELVPEFFYLPEMFQNSNNFDLGVKQSGTALNDVVLPAWAHGDSHEFIRMHRQALECDYVSEHLHEWIDLIFGYKQNGEPAKEAYNVFHHLFYEENVDFDNIDDPLTRNATLGFINNFGQIPAQLFKRPHPQRKVQAASSVCFIPGVTTPKLFYHSLESLRPSARPVKELKGAAGDIVVNEKNQVVVLEQNKVFLPPNNFLAWGFNDRSLRLGTVGSEKSACILETNDVYEVTCVASADGKILFAGLTTGSVVVWSLNKGHNAGNALISSGRSARLQRRKALDGHTDVVTAIATCAAHNFVVSASRDRSAIIWHLTRLTYIRQLSCHSGAVSALAINEATGDIATASGPLLFVWTLNGTLLAAVNTVHSGLFSNPSSLILCVAFSTANEWDSRNVLMCGTSDGLVKIYSCEFKKVAATANDANSSADVGDIGRKSPQDTKALKEHLLKRQQRIQQHQQKRLGISLEHASQDSQASSPCPTPSALSSSDEPPYPLLADGTTAESRAPPNDIRWKRFLHLRRVLSEHTAFNQGNAQPAPITSIAPSKDHKNLIVGDGVGRVWTWSMETHAHDNHVSNLPGPGNRH